MAAEEKAARLEESLAIKDRVHSQQLTNWADTVKLRDEAIGRKEKQIKEQVAVNQQLTSQLNDLRDRVGFGFNEQFATPDGKTLCQVLESEISARKTSQDQLGVAMRDLRQYELGLKKASEERDELAKKCQQLESQWMAAIEELARHNTPAQPVPEPHHQVTEWTLTFADLVEFCRLFKPAMDG